MNYFNLKKIYVILFKRIFRKDKINLHLKQHSEPWFASRAFPASINSMNVN